MTLAEEISLVGKGPEVHDSIEVSLVNCQLLKENSGGFYEASQPLQLMVPLRMD